MILKTQRLLLVAALLLWCSLLVFVRLAHTSESWLGFMLWNLMLAVIPVLGASAFEPKRNKSLLVPGLCFVIWLLFFPNAPYLCTDLIHLRRGTGAPLWYDLVLYLSFAGTGVFFGYASLLDVHRKIENCCGKVVGWNVAVASLMLCAFGIYIGRFLRWNSWDAFTRPLTLAKHLFLISTRPSEHPNPLAVTLVFGIALILGYLALRVTMPPAPHDAQ